METKQNVPRIDKKTIIPSITYFDENYDIGEEIIKLFNESKEQFFEDGIETQFSKELTEFILKYGNKAVDILSGLFEYGKVSPESIDESLRWIGKIRHEDSYLYRKWLVERCLFHPNPKVRDAASIGISMMDDPKSIPSLKKATEKETIKEIKEDMESVLAQLILTNPNGIPS